MKEDDRVRRILSSRCVGVVTLVCVGFLLNGCVMSEKYEAEKARSLNFQRLLAQEEKRTAELDNEAKRSKKELAEYEARNRELTAQVQAVREQMARVQEEADAVKEAALLERKAKADMKRSMVPAQKAPAVPVVPPASESGDLSAAALGIAPEAPAVPAPTESLFGGKSGQIIHVVKPGETLYRISRKYGLKVDTVRKWNKLPDDIIEVGQKLIVGQE